MTQRQPQEPEHASSELVPPFDSARKLRESEARLNFALNAGKLGTWEVDLSTMSMTCSDQCKANFGRTSNAPFTYEMLHAAIHPADRERVAAAIVRSIETFGDYEAEYRCLWPDGTVRWITATGRVVSDDQGRPQKMAGVTLDTTTRKHAEAQFEILLNQAPLGVFLIDADFRIRQVNPAALPAFGDIPDLIGRDFGEVMHILWPQAYADEVVGIYRHTLKTGESYSTVERIEHRLDRGTKESYEWRTDRIVLPDGRFGVVCYFRDVSQQSLARLAVERSELALRESEERLRLATDNAEIGFWDVDVVNNNLIWPPRVKAMFGISPHVPVSMDDFYNGLHPDDRAATSEAYAAAADPSRRALYDVEYRTIGKEDGIVRWVAAKGRGVFGGEGDCLRVIGTAMDITGRKATEVRLAESEARYRALAQQVADGIFITDPQGRYTDANDAAAEMLGYTLEELFRLGISDVLDPEELEKLPEQSRRLEQSEVVQSDWRFRRKDGSVLIGDLVVRRFPDGRLQGVVRDVTERRRVEDELRRANSDLEQFAYSASHDLQEPIRNVAVYSEILEKRYGSVLDNRAREYLGFVTNGARRMDALVNDLLAYTQCGQADDTTIVVSDASSALEGALEDLATTVANTGAKVSHGPLPTVEMPAVQLQQLFQNLVGNAIKYRRDLTTPEVFVSAERLGSEWKFSVSDNGIGINPKHQEQVFGIFKRLHNDDKYSGTGIGLAICQKIVERRGGRIWVESAGQNQGSTFCFTLPARSREDYF